MSNQQRAESLMRDVYASPLTGDPAVRDVIAGALDDAEARGRAQQDEPLLGLATTRQLLDEIRARIETDVAGKGLDYRTVGSH